MKARLISGIEMSARTGVTTRAPQMSYDSDCIAQPSTTR